MRLSVKEAAKKLKVCERTIWVRMKAGIIPFEVEVDETLPANFAGRNRRWVIFPDPPAPVEVPSVTQPEPVSEPSVPSTQRPLSPTEKQQQDDAAFAQAYLEGLVPDSLGNYYRGNTSKSLISGHPELKPPAPEVQKPEVNLRAHYRMPKKQEPMSEKNWKTWKPKPEIRSADNTGLNSPEVQEIWRKAKENTLRDQETERRVREGTLVIQRGPLTTWDGKFSK